MLTLWRVLRVGLQLRLYMHLPAPIWRRCAAVLHGVLWPRQWWQARRDRSVLRYRLACEALGPLAIKMGQVLSTRCDWLPVAVSQELAKLQDQVAPFPGALAVAEIEQALAAPISELFAEFDVQPLAAASVAQVHAARLLSGEVVVVKILRPGIEAELQHDIRWLKRMARGLMVVVKATRSLRLLAAIAELDMHLQAEMDLRREAGNAAQLARNFAHSADLIVPAVHWPYVRQRVLVMTRVDGIPIDDKTALLAQGTDLKRLAERGIQLFFKQVFTHRFFHADMHPGNIFVSRKSPEKPPFIAVDFGIMGSLSAEDQYYLAANLLAFLKRDYQQVAKLHVASGWVPKTVRVDQLEAAIRAVCEPMLAQSLHTVSFGQLLLQLLQTARAFEMVVQPQLFLLQKTLINVEGLGRQLYPELDVWGVSRPIVEAWMRQQVGVKAMLKKVKNRAPFWLAEWPDLPDQLQQVLAELVHNKPCDQAAQSGAAVTQLSCRRLTLLQRGVPMFAALCLSLAGWQQGWQGIGAAWLVAGIGLLLWVLTV